MKDLKKILMPTIYEYLLIVLPVVIYVGLESMKKGYDYFIKSPEWAIASIFLSFQAVSLFIRNTNKENRRINTDFLGILLLFVITLTIFASLNAYSSLSAEEHDTLSKEILRIILLFISSISFFFLVIASKGENKLSHGNKVKT